MQPREHEALKKIVCEWLQKADEDIRSAKALLAQDPPLLFPSCFHAQQSAEKYLKAYLTWHQVEFPKTHSIRELLKRVKSADKDLASHLNSAASLTPYGVEVRYPSDLPEVSQAHAQEATELAEKVRQAILKTLPPELTS
ncbi:MAG: HEPN domain-containing protein [Planctomycetes bacterium]|nr:HEPN domain-containing protein [Planctomycetota bacterium]